MLRDDDPHSSLFLSAKYWQVIIAKGQGVRSIQAPSGRTTLDTGLNMTIAKYLLSLLDNTVLISLMHSWTRHLFVYSITSYINLIHLQKLQAPAIKFFSDIDIVRHLDFKYVTTRHVSFNLTLEVVFSSCCQNIRPFIRLHIHLGFNPPECTHAEIPSHVHCSQAGFHSVCLKQETLSVYKQPGSRRYIRTMNPRHPTDGTLQCRGGGGAARDPPPPSMWPGINQDRHLSVSPDRWL